MQFSADDSLASAAFLGPDQHYLILTRSLDTTEQDRLLGQDQIHIELDDQIHSSYGGVAFGSLYSGRLELALNNCGSGDVGASMIIVSFLMSADRFENLCEVTKLLFDGHSSFTVTT